MASDNCCNDLWWCDGSGTLVESLQKPGADYRGPWRSEIAALVGCPVKPFSLMCGDRGYTLPGRVSVSLVNPTGCLIANSRLSNAPITYGLGGGDSCGFLGHGWCGAEYDVDPMEFTAAAPNACENFWVTKPPTMGFKFYIGVQTSGGAVTGIPRLTALAPTGGTTSGGLFPWAFTPNTGWSGSQVCSGLVTCAQGPVNAVLDQTLQFPLYAGKIGLNSPCPTVVGTFDVYITI